MLKFYARFEISEETGNPLTDHDMTELHYAKITSLQVRQASIANGLKLFCIFAE